MKITDMYREMASGNNHSLVEDMTINSPEDLMGSPRMPSMGGGFPPLPSQMMEEEMAPPPVKKKKENIQEASGSMATPNCMKCGGKLTIIHKTTRAGITMLSCPMCYTLLAAYEKR